jgi:hypothetical protein
VIAYLFTLTRNSIISALLIVTLATSASACIEGAGSYFSDACIRIARPSCERQLHSKTRGCSPVLRGIPTKCNIRGLVQFHVVRFTKFEVPSLLRLVTEQVLVPSDPAQVVEAGLWTPGQSECIAAVQCPRPVNTVVQGGRITANLLFVGEVGSAGECSGY